MASVNVTSGYNGEVADVLISLTKLGNQAVEKGSVRIDQIREALDVQVMENMEERSHRLIGEILVALSYMTASQASEVDRDMWDSLNVNP